MSNLNPSGRDIRPSSASSSHGAVRQDSAAPLWAPALAAIPDEDPSLEPSSAFMQHQNHSVPCLPSERPPQYPEYSNEYTKMPYDSTASLDISALHISDNLSRSGSMLSYASDPIPRAPSSLSTHSSNSSHRLFMPRTAATLPPPPNQSFGIPTIQGHHLNNNASDFFGVTSEQADRVARSRSPIPEHAQQGWQQQPRAREFNSLYAAASDVLGLGPPAPPVGPGGYTFDGAISSTQAAPAGSPPFNGNPLYGPANVAADIHPETDEIEVRPPFNRNGTSASVTPSTHKSKAIDLSAPPYTKDYIDQYRQRIKNDPDPEAHFLYAKYLIDAAKYIRASSKDQRAAKKFSEILIGESLKVMRRLATQGEAYGEAQFFLANCYGTGALGLQVDHERAYHLYLQAAKQGHAAACYRVAVCNEIGAGTRREFPRAAAFYRKAASLGDTAAMYKLGTILLHGSLGEQKNPREAVSWLKRASEQADEDNPHALHELGLLYEQPNSTLVPYNPAYAKSLFTQAAQLGYTQSQYKLGQCYEYGSLTCPVDPRRSIAWYTKAAEKGDAEAELALSGWYLTGSEGVLKQSDSEAYLWARRAANKGLSKAEYAVGYYAEVGIGVKQDIEFAKRWYMRAAAQGNKRAMNRLTEMKRMGAKRANVVRPTRQQAKDECVIC